MKLICQSRKWNLDPFDSCMCLLACIPITFVGRADTTSIPKTFVGTAIPTKLVGTVYFDKSCLLVRSSELNKTCWKLETFSIARYVKSCCCGNTITGYHYTRNPSQARIQSYLRYLQLHTPAPPLQKDEPPVTCCQTNNNYHGC